MRELHGCRNARVFGSVATRESPERSDVDFLVDLDEGRNLFNLCGLLPDLKDELFGDVDLVEADSVSAALFCLFLVGDRHDCRDASPNH